MHRLCLILSLAMIASPVFGDQARRSAHLLPATTKAYASINGVEELRGQWKQTQFSQLLEAPVMQNFRGELQKRLDAQEAEMVQLYGVSLDELLDVATGEAAIGLIETSGEQLTRMFLVEVGPDSQAADDLLHKMAERLAAQGGRRSELAIAGVQVAAYAVPQREAADQEVLSFVHEGVLGVGGDSATVRTVLETWDEPAEGKLASLPAFADTMQRVLAAAPQWTPPVQFFADPNRLDELLDPTELLADGTRRPTLARKHGFSAMQGIGGALNLMDDGCQVLYRMAVYAPPPWEKGMQMLDFPVGADFLPAAWAPDYLNSFTTVHWRLEKILENIGPLFDDLAANDDRGAFDDIVRDVKNDLNVDLHALFGRLGPRVAVSSDAQEPVSATSQRDLVAIEIKPGQEKTVEQEIARLLRDDPTVQKIALKVPRREGTRIVTEDRTLWRVGESSGLASREERKGFSAAGVLVARGYLLIATNYEMLRKMFTPASQVGGAKIADADDFKGAMQHLMALGDGDDCARIFARTDRDFFTTYELLRQGRLAEAETIYGRALTKVLEQWDEEQSLDFATLPEFRLVAEYFGNAAMSVKPHPAGWLIVGFIEPKP